jgi:hypothetical protein
LFCPTHLVKIIGVIFDSNSQQFEKKYMHLFERVDEEEGKEEYKEMREYFICDGG